MPGGAYHEDPGLVLTLLHRSGFLFASPRMPDRVILDQRWAVQGIYTLFDREEGCWRKLEGAGGKFTLRDLREWIWTKKGYAETEQAVFLEMMLACGICFQLLPEWLTPDAQAVYVAPAALPEEDWFRARVEADRAGLPEREWKPVANVPEEDWRAIQVKLGEIWGRTAVLWRTGGQVKAFYRPGEAPPGGDSFLALEWHRAPDAFAGEVRLRGFGGDQAFFAEVEKLCRAFEGKETDAPDKTAEPSGLAEVRHPAGQPTAEQRNAPKVAISFAGWEDRNAPQEQVAMELCRALQGRVTVEHYRMEQARPETEKQGKPQRYLEHLLAGDFVLVVLTEKYVRSPWCLYEAMRLWERLIDGEYNAGVMRAFAFPEVYCRPGDDAKWVRLSRELEECWAGHAAKFNEALKGLDFLEAERKAAESDLKPWYAFAGIEGNREALAGELLKGWLPKPVPDGMPPETFFEQHAESILQSMADPAPIFELAKKAWKKNQPDHAVAAYREALRRRDGAEWRTGLERPEVEADLEAIRRWILQR
jgi:internalin A